MNEVEAFLARVSDAEPTITADIAVDGRQLSVSIDCDEATVVAATSFAKSVLSTFGQFEESARSAVTAEMLGSYNEGWRHHDEVQDDGTLRGVSEPELTAPEFSRRLKAESVSFVGSRGVEFVFGDDDLFWGHYIVAASKDGGNTWSHITLAG